MTTWPTRDGWVAALLAFALTDVGAIGGNNLIVGVACVGWAVLLVDAAVGRWNLRALRVGRTLPEDVFAHTRCRGSFLFQNPRARGALREVTVTDGVGEAFVPEVGAGEEVRIRAWWRFRQRGPTSLGAMVARSRYPFGLFQHTLPLDGGGEALVIFPRPVPGRGRAAGEAQGDSQSRKGHERTGDFEELRPYQPGDRLRAIHAPTSARVGRPMVVVRGGEGQAGVMVQVRSEGSMEDELERATGAVLDAMHRGLAVGVQLDGQPDLARISTGVRWRRSLLQGLATHALEEG